MKTLEERCAKYEWMLRHGRCCKAKDCSIEVQVERFRRGQEWHIWVVSATKQVLDQEGVSVVQYPYYCAFALNLGRLRDRQMLSGESLASEASILIGVWVARGMSQSVLESIRAQVFNIGAPTP